MAKTTKPKASKKAKAAKKPAASKTAAQVKHPAKQISENDLMRLLGRCNSLGTQAAEITGEMGNLVKQAVDGKNLDRTAFTIVRRLYKMSTQKLHSTLPALLLYIDMARLEEKLASEPQLDLSDGDETDAPKVQNGGATGAGDVQTTRTSTLVNPNKLPSSKQVKDAADRAERRSDDERDLRPRHLRDSASQSEAKH